MSALVGVIMGSKSDWSTMKSAVDMLEEFEVPYEVKVVSAHRTPDLMYNFSETAESEGFKVIIAGAGGAAHLPGMVASFNVLNSSTSFFEYNHNKKLIKRINLIGRVTKGKLNEPSIFLYEDGSVEKRMLLNY